MMHTISVPAATQSEARTPLMPFLALLALLGVIALGASDLQTDPRLRWELLVVGLLLHGLVGIAWLLAGWWELGGRWLVILVATGSFLYSVLYSDWHPFGIAFLLLAPLPVLMALALQGRGAAMVVAGLETVLLLTFHLTVERTMALLAVWLILLIVHFILQPLQEVTAWSWQQYAQARRLLDAARDHKADLEQALQELMNANRQLDLLNERLAAMRLLAEDAGKTKAAFVAKVSHEFRTPLNMIIGLIDLTVQTPELYGAALPSALLQDLAIVQRNCTHLASMIDDVLDLSQTEAGRLVLRREWIDLRSEVEAALTVVRPLMEKKQLAVRTQIAEPLPTVYGDRTRLRQVILNLLSNAARYTEQGWVGVTLTVETQALVVRISDTGPGIAASDLEKIFEPFYQAGVGLWQERRGSGLGLSISKQLIELHHGHLWVESTVGVGSTFAFRLPLPLPITPPTNAGRWISEDWLWHERLTPPRLPGPPTGQRIVLYDESGELAALLAQCADDVEIVDAPTFAEALQAAHACPAHLLMLNTAQVAAIGPLVQQATAVLPDTPVLGYALPTPRSDPRLADLVCYLTKPITRADLSQVLTRVEKVVHQILIVDDDPEFRSLLTRMLQSLDSTLIVNVAENSRQGLTLLQDQPDLLFLDLTMPELDGWQLLHLKNADPRLQAIPVIILSAQDPEGEMLTSDLFVAGLGRGLSGHQLLQCASTLATLFLQPEHRRDPVPQ